MLHVQSLAYWKQHSFPIKIVLPGNIYGPHDNFDLEAAHVIPALVRKFVEATENNTNVKVWGDGKATRDFIHAHDVAVGIVNALNLSQPELINLSSGKEVSIKQVVDYLIDISKFSNEIEWDSSRVSGQSRRFFDISKSEELINFKQSFSLYDGLKDTFDWYKSNKDIARNNFERNIEEQN
jgi:nucleoside-diphosphate-sugar epimerase